MENEIILYAWVVVILTTIPFQQLQIRFLRTDREVGKYYEMAFLYALFSTLLCYIILAIIYFWRFGNEDLEMGWILVVVIFYPGCFIVYALNLITLLLRTRKIIKKRQDVATTM